MTTTDKDEEDEKEEEAEEEEIKLAIARSLQDKNTLSDPGTSREIIDLLTDDEPEIVKDRSRNTQSTDVVVSDQKPGILGLDRKAMELERLARKRKASISLLPRPFRTATKSTHGNPELLTSPPDIFLSQRSHTSKDSAVTTPLLEIPIKGPSFPSGTVKKTWAYGYPRHEDIKIEEVLDRDNLTLAVLSSFQWDVEWILGKIDRGTTKIVFVMQAKDEVTKRQYAQETANMTNFRLCFPPMEGQVNCMHSKLMLLAYPSHLRIVVPTANLTPYDWGETGVMENMVFIVDLPRLTGTRATPETLTFFGKELLYFLQAMGLQQDIVSSIFNFDFSKTKDLAFIHTIGGAHVGESEPWRRTGYCGLGRAVKQLGLSNDKELYIDFVTSSIGAINVDFLAILYLAAQGDDGLKEYKWRTDSVTKTQADKKGTKSTRIVQPIPKGFYEALEEKFRVFFPLEETVKKSRGGVACGGTICFASRWYNAGVFSQKILRDCKSRRKGLLMHNKVKEN